MGQREWVGDMRDLQEILRRRSREKVQVSQELGIFQTGVTGSTDREGTVR